MPAYPLRNPPPTKPKLDSEGPADSARPSDSELVQRITAKDQIAIAELYDRYAVLVFSVARHVLYDEASAEDVTQEIFLQLWRAPDSFDPARGSLSTWLTVLTRHRAIDRCRKRRVEVDVADVVIPIDGKQLSEVQRDESIGRLRSLLAEMPGHLRSALQLAYIEGLSHSEISARTGEPLGTTKSRIRLAMNWLRKRLCQEKHC